MRRYENCAVVAPVSGACAKKIPCCPTLVALSNGVTLLVTGPFQEQDLGLKCYHSKVGAVELLLNHCVEGSDEYVVVVMTAGADTFTSGLFTRFDLTFLVVESTRNALGVYRQHAEYACG
ncbi:hypothetical protein [Ktedonobacter racemifer]|uniref:hypothetical protein n=1 Tax=Ktedonobacter racemifer TaxID=363277 RepID=UPI0012F8C922|nr:hypothetical protein [Ktedonobacter racemifer]